MAPTFIYIPSGAAASPYLMDNHPAPIAYHYIQLTATEIDVKRVRRSSDNSERDLTPTEITDNTYTTWVGAGNDGYDVTNYNQGTLGSSYDITQATSAEQFQSVSSGSLVTNTRGDYAAEVIANNQVMSTNYTPSNSEITIFAGVEYGGTGAQFLVSWDDDANQRAMLVNSGAWSIDFGAMANGVTATSGQSVDLYQLVAGSDSENSINGGSVTTFSADSNSYGTRMDVMGRDGGNNSLLDGFFRYLIIYDSNESSNVSSIQSYVTI